MAGDQLEEREPVLTKSLYGAFKRPMPEALQDPSDELNDLLGQLSENLAKLEKRAAQTGAHETAKQAQVHREALGELAKKGAAETTAKKKDAKKIATLTAEAAALQVLVQAELEVPARETNIIKALETLMARPKPPQGKIKEFDKRAETCSKEKDPKKRCDLYFQLERDIHKADLVGREKDDPGSTWQDQVEMAMQDARPLGSMAKVKGFFRAPPQMSDDDFAATKVAFVNSFKKKIDDMAFSVPEVSVEAFQRDAGLMLAEVEAQLFAPGNKPANSHELGKLLVKANTTALKRLMVIKRKYPANQTPQVMVEDGKIVVIKPAPKVQSLVLQGGGSKGAGYPPMLDEMKAAGMLDDVDLLVGTSIGALNASCLACGGLADERQILDVHMFKEVFDARNMKKQYPDVSFGGGIWPTCAGQIAKVDQLTSASIANNLKDQSENDISSKLTAKLSNLDDETLAKMGLAGAWAEVIEREINKLAKKVKNQDYGGSDRTTQMMTFKDLALLHQLDPISFKELTITGWEGTGDDGHVVYFNAKNYGDMPIALAARISAGLPIFAPVFWQGHGPFYDGGLGSNTPIEATPGLDEFYQGKNPADVEEELQGDVPVEVQEAMAKTMLMTFDDQGQGERNLYGQGRNTMAPTEMEKKFAIDKGLNPKYANVLKGDATKTYNTGVNALQVYHGDMSTVTLDPSEEDVEYAESMARMKGLEQLDARSDQAAVVKCTNSDEALMGMSSSDKRNLVKAGRPKSGDPLVLELFDKCVQFIAIEDAFNSRGNNSAGFLGVLETSPLCQACASDIRALAAQYDAHVQKGSEPDALTQGIKTTTDTIAKLPAYLRSMLKQAVLLPMQQRRRNLPQPTGSAAPTFLWQQQFSASALKNSLTVAAQANVPYIKEASAAHDALTKYEQRSAEVAGKSKPKDACESARKALTALEIFQVKLRVMGKAEPYPGNPTMQAYIGWLNQRAGAEADRLRAIAKGKDANYPRYPFNAWNKQDWETKKAEAIEKGAIEDPGSTGLGALMARAVTAQTAADRAAEATNEKLGQAAWNAWDKIIRKLREIQSQTDNANFAAYLDNGISQATRLRDLLPAP